jgi:hypothetical protein
LERFTDEQIAAALRDLEEFGWVMIDRKEDASEVANAAARRGVLSDIQAHVSPRGRAYFVVSKIDYVVDDRGSRRVS